MKFVRTPYEVKYRVFGSAGIVCATAYDKPIPNSKERPQYDRMTYVYSRIGRRWVLVSWHISNITLKKQ